MAAPDTSVDWAAWVQAVGSVIALFLTGGLAWWETRQRRKDDGARAADLLRARVAVLRYADDALVAFLAVQRSDLRMREPQADDLLKATCYALEQVENVRVTDMPTPTSVNHFFFANAEFIQLHARLKRFGPKWLNPAEVDQLEAKRQAIAEALKGMEGEISRLERGSKD